jgi:hypothetical protein
MGLDGKGPQMSRQLELPPANRGETPTGKRGEEAPTATHENERSGASGLMEKVCERPNLVAALKRVRMRIPKDLGAHSGIDLGTDSGGLGRAIGALRRRIRIGAKRRAGIRQLVEVGR